MSGGRMTAVGAPEPIGGAELPKRADAGPEPATERTARTTAVPAATAAAPELPSAPDLPPSPDPAVRYGTRNTVVLLVFTAVTNLADGVTKIALPLLANPGHPAPRSRWRRSRSACRCRGCWRALHVGVLVDRVDRRRLLWGANGLRLLALGTLIRAAATDGATVPALCAVGAVLGVAEVVALTAASALIPALTPPQGRERANAWIAGAETVCNEFCGPFVGGLLLAAGTGVALGATWVSYLAVSFVPLLLVGRFRAARETPVPDRPESVNRQIADGLRHLWQQLLLRTMALILTVLCACWGAWLALMPLFATDAMGVSPQEYGAILSALGIGGLVGALVVTRANRLLGRRRVMFADLVGTFVMMAVPALTTSVWGVAAAAFAGGAGARCGPSTPGRSASTWCPTACSAATTP